jgi:hypothetical protein
MTRGDRRAWYFADVTLLEKSPRSILRARLETARFDAGASAAGRRAIRDRLLSSRTLDGPAFTRLHADDLTTLASAYDEMFLDGHLRAALGTSLLRFGFSTRATRRGGGTFRAGRAGGEAIRYDIVISTTPLIESFRDGRGDVRVCGLVCCDRLDALQRVMEHELVHLAEFLAWDGSSCARPRFQGIAARLFGHTSHRHEMLTPAQRASVAHGIRPGDAVWFEHDGQRYDGTVNRITKRATVLVPHPAGRVFSDGRTYQVVYVPIPSLQRR